MSFRFPHFCVVSAMSFAFLAACGDDVTEKIVYHDNGSISVLDAGKKLKKQQCDSTNAGELLFVVDSSDVFLCNGEEWETLKGDTGARGDKGKTGAKGETGAKGKTGAKGDDGESLTGSAGPRGSTGADGLDGTGCNVVKEESGVVTIACGSDTTKLYRSMCGDKPYDADSLFCANDELYDPSEYFVDDRDNHVYRYITVKEGKKQQVWMAENLNYDYNKGSATSKCYGDLDRNCEKYGRLYSWMAAVDSAGLFSNDCKGCGFYSDDETWVKVEAKKIRGTCPFGWHLPDSLELKSLLESVSDSVVSSVYFGSGAKLKSTEDWSEGLDKIGFSLLPGQVDGKYVYMCSSSELSPSSFFFAFFSDGSGHVTTAYIDKRRVNTFTVRCVRD